MMLLCGRVSSRRDLCCSADSTLYYAMKCLVQRALPVLKLSSLFGGGRYLVGSREFGAWCSCFYVNV